jgi:hypothetical protein
MYGLKVEPTPGIHPMRSRVPYKTFKSKYGPRYVTIETPKGSPSARN